jgi:hypothetical protein
VDISPEKVASAARTGHHRRGPASIPDSTNLPKALECADAAADIPQVEAAHIPWRPLGRLLVERGLLRDDELEHALDEQEISGRRLGEILIELGCVTHSALSFALAEQYGFELTAETGFGTGLRAQIERRQDEGRGPDTEPPPQGVDPEQAPALSLVPDPLEPTGVADDVLHLPQLEEQWAKLAAAEERLAETESELATLRRTGKRRRKQVARLIQRVRKRDARIAALAGTLSSVPHADAPLGHLVFTQLGQRYELVERDGAPPGQNVMLELPEVCDASLVVVRVGRSPLPNDPRPCAFAQQVYAPRD